VGLWSSGTELDRFLNILNNNSIQYKRKGNVIKIEHDERAAVPSHGGPMIAS